MRLVILMLVSALALLGQITSYPSVTGGGVPIAPWTACASGCDATISASPWTITAATHNQGTKVVLECYSNATPRVRLAPASAGCNYTLSTAGEIVLTYTGTLGLVTIDGGGTVGPQGPAGQAGAAVVLAGDRTTVDSAGGNYTVDTDNTSVPYYVTGAGIPSSSGAGAGNCRVGSNPPDMAIGGTFYTNTLTGALYSCTATNVWTQVSGVTTPGGSAGQVQYNNGSGFSGASELFYNNSNGSTGVGTTATSARLNISTGGAQDGNNYGNALQIVRPAAGGQQAAFIREGLRAVSLGYLPGSSTFGFGGSHPTDGSFVPSYISFDTSGHTSFGGNITTLGEVKSTPVSGTAIFSGVAASSTDLVRYQATIPTIATWYWGADGADSAKWKLSTSSVFASPAMTVTTAGDTTIAGSTTLTGTLTGTITNMRQDGIGSNLTNGVVLENQTAATSGQQQDSPALVLKGKGWNAAGAQSEGVDFYLRSRPWRQSASGPSRPNPGFEIGYKINNGTYATLFHMYNHADGFDSDFSLPNYFLGMGAGNQSLSAGSMANIGIGNNALNLMTSGNENLAIGNSAGYNLSSGYWNTLLGHEAGIGITTAYQNVFVGQNAGSASPLAYAIKTGEQNTHIGVDSGPVADTTIHNTVALGYSAKVTANNQGVLGNSGTKWAVGGWTNPDKTLVVADPTTLGSEVLDPITDTNWDGYTDFSVAGDSCAYTHSSGSGTCKTFNAVFNTPIVANALYAFQFEITAHSGGDPLCSIQGVPGTDFYLAHVRPGTPNSILGTYTVHFRAGNAASQDFQLYCTSDSSADNFTIDNVSLKQVTTGELDVNNTISAGSTIESRSNGFKFPDGVTQAEGASNVTHYAYNLTNGSGVSGDLSTAGAGKTLTFTKCPIGVYGTSTWNFVYISGGTGTAEAATVTGGTCTPGLANGTLVVTTANTHTGSWTARSATAGIVEMLSAKGRAYIPGGTHTVYAQVNVRCHNTIQGDGPDSIIAPNASTLTIFRFNNVSDATCSGFPDVVYRDFHVKGDSFAPTNTLKGIHVTGSYRDRLEGLTFTNVQDAIILDRSNEATVNKVQLVQHSKIFFGSTNAQTAGANYSWNIKISDILHYRYSTLDSSWSNVPLITFQRCVTCSLNRMSTRTLDWVADGIHLLNNNEAVSLHDVMIFGAKRGIYLAENTVDTVTDHPKWTRMIDPHIDGFYNYGIYLSKSTYTNIIGPVMTNSNASNGVAAIYSTVDAVHTTISNGLFTGCNKGDLIGFAANANDMTIMGNVFATNSDSSAWDVNISGTSSRYRFFGNRRGTDDSTQGYRVAEN